jgi:4-aminobutyrate aminotransferase/(S)-3-amino-2-methylpropionate transaminase
MLDTDPSLPQTRPAGQSAVPAQARHLRTEIPGPRSREFAARKAAAVAGGVGTMLPVYIERAGGGVLVDVDGNTLIDFGSGIAVVGVGNAAPEVVARVQEQVARFTHTCFMVTPYSGYVEVCEALNRLTPGDGPKRSALFNSGAEAVENAVKIARRATGRDAVIVFDHAYHGRTNLTMAMTAKNLPYKDGFGPFAGEIYRAPMSYPFREPTPIDGAQAAAHHLMIIRYQDSKRHIPSDYVSFQIRCILVQSRQVERLLLLAQPAANSVVLPTKVRDNNPSVLVDLSLEETNQAAVHAWFVWALPDWLLFSQELG